MDIPPVNLITSAPLNDGLCWFRFWVR